MVVGMSRKHERWLSSMPPASAADVASSNYKRCTRSLSALPSAAEAAFEAELKHSDGDRDGAFLRTYTRNDLFGEVNFGLRSDDASILENYGGYIFAVKDAMRRKGQAIGWYKGVVFRGMTVSEDILAWWLTAEEGQKFLFPGFVSNSKTRDRCFGGNLLFEIDCDGPGWIYALDIEQWSVYPGEGEVLFFPYSGFSFISAIENDGVHLIKLRACDRQLIDPNDLPEKIAKLRALRTAHASFVLHVGMRVVAGNKKYAKVTTTALRHRADEAKGGNFNGVQVLNGSWLEIQQLHDQNEWSFVKGESGSGWIKSRNLHVQLAGVTAASQVGAGFFMLRKDRRAICGNTRHSVGCTALRHEPMEAKGSNFNGNNVRDGAEVILLEDTTSDGDWANVAATDGRAGWIKTRNLHVQLV